MKAHHGRIHIAINRFLLIAAVLPFSFTATACSSANDAVLSAVAATSAQNYFAPYGNHGGVYVTLTRDGEAMTKLAIRFDQSPYTESYDLDLLANVIIKQMSRAEAIESKTTTASGDASFADLINRARDLTLYALAPERYLWLPYFGEKVLQPNLAAVVDHLGGMLVAAGRDITACKLFDDAGLSGESVESPGGLSTADLQLAGHHVRSVWVHDGYKLVLLDKPAFVIGGAKIATLDPLIDTGMRNGAGVAYDLATRDFADKTASFVCMKKL